MKSARRFAGKGLFSVASALFLFAGASLLLNLGGPTTRTLAGAELQSIRGGIDGRDCGTMPACLASVKGCGIITNQIECLAHEQTVPEIGANAKACNIPDSTKKGCVEGALVDCAQVITCRWVDGVCESTDHVIRLERAPESCAATQDDPPKNGD